MKPTIANPRTRHQGAPNPETILERPALFFRVTRHPYLRIGVVVVAAVLLAAGAYSALQGSGPASVLVTTTGPHVISTPLGALGTSSAGSTLPVSLPFATQISTIGVEPGQTVQKGTPLFTINPSVLEAGLSALEVRLQSDQASLAFAQAILRDQPAKRSPAVVAAEQAKVAAINNRIALDAQLIQAAQKKTNTVVASPAAGTIGQVFATGFQFVASNRPIMQILDLSTILVTANFPIADVSEVHVGDPVTLEFGALENLKLTGSLVSVAQVANTDGLDFQVIAQARNTAGSGAIPGLTAFVTDQVTTNASVAVPNVAVLNSADNPSVLVASGGVVHLRQVTLGTTDGQYYQITSGLSAGQLCVVGNRSSLHDGSKVRVSRVLK